MNEAGLSVIFRGSNQLYEWNTNAVTPTLDRNATTDTANIATFNDPLPAGSTENTLMFSYRAEVNMAGGEVEFSLPTGWAITKSLTVIADPDTDAAGIIDDPYVRYGTSFLVEVHERIGSRRPVRQ